MTKEKAESELNRLRTAQSELASLIARMLPQDGVSEPQPGLHFRRNATPGGRVHAVADPAFCVIAQGSKLILLGEETFRYDSAHYLITTVELPLIGEVTQATPEEPYLAFRLILDQKLVSSVMVEAGISYQRDGNAKALDVSALDADLLDATVRLVRLVEKPHEYRVLSPLIIREIVYRLLTGVQGERLAHLATFGGHSHRMVRAVEKIRATFNEPLKIEDIAKELHMSVSGFHAHFKSVTAMSPLQFQKQLRLQEARRLMLSKNYDAAQAGFSVGYDDASHFNREYKRHFGEPPMRDVERLRELAETATP